MDGSYACYIGSPRKIGKVDTIDTLPIADVFTRARKCLLKISRKIGHQAARTPRTKILNFTVPPTLCLKKLYI